MAWPLLHIFWCFNEIITRSYYPNDLFCPFLTFTTHSHHLLSAPGRRQAIIAGGGSAEMQRELREFGWKFAVVTRGTFTIRQKISEKWKVKGKAGICITTREIIMQSNQFNTLFYFPLFRCATISTHHQRLELCPGFGHIPRPVVYLVPVESSPAPSSAVPLL